MRIGIISNSDQFIPLAYTLANNSLQVCIFFTPGEDSYVHQKVNAFANATGLSLVSGEDVYGWISEYKPDVVFVYGFRHLLDVTQFSIPVFNIHPGALPSFRGPVPVFWQLKKGVSHLCLSIHVLSSRFDDGTVVWARSIPDQPHYNYALVHQVFSQLVIEGVYFILHALSSKLPLPAITDGMPSAYHKRPAPEDVLINWEHMSATVICNLVRACNPWNKGASTILNGQEVKLMDAMYTGMETTLSPGTISSAGAQLLIATADRQLVHINMLQMHDTFVPAYQAVYYGIEQGKRLG
jgi:methionyl-tRNA formyltransferase